MEIHEYDDLEIERQAKLMFDDYAQNTLTWPKDQPKPTWDNLKEKTKDSWRRIVKRDI